VRTSRLETSLLVVIVGLGLALAAAFTAATPVLEASDEARHFGYLIDWRASGHLPVATAEHPGYAHQEALQPPLYYLLARLVTLDISFDDAADHYRWRSGAPVGRADLPGPRNMFEPVAPRGSPPGAGDAVMRIRWLTVLITLATVVATWACAGAAGAASDTRLLAACLVAFNPMFLFIGSAVNNDALVALLCALALFACLRALERPLTPSRAAGLGALAGLSTLAKLSGLVLAPAIALVVVSRARDTRSRLTASVAACGGFLVVAGWWFVWHRLQYGAFGPGGGHAELLGNGRAAFSPLALAREWSGFFKSFWGVFGAFNVVYPEWIYLLLLIATLTLAAAVGTLWLGQPRSRPLLVILLVVAANLAAVAWWTAQVTASQGRLMFPSIAAIATLSAMGLARWPPRIARPIGGLIVAGLFAASAYAAFILIPGGYLRG
jgi:4-amino-4-deoxy-L-arabinose transferase-like glycosyltransferase